MVAAAPRALAGVLFAALLAAASGVAVPDPSWCGVAARTQAGWVCGEQRRASSGAAFASFLAVPYAKQPLGHLRFQELQPLEPWEEPINATKEGPICPQTDVLYKELMQAKGGMSEECIHANVFVPLDALPSRHDDSCTSYKPLPILVFIHGGGFAFGSGDPDLHGPEYLLSKDVIVITFNYRLNVFGFLSLNSSFIPGNNGLRDAVTLLRWVRDNARCFGGDPERVTVAGQSAGAVMAHMLTLIPAAEGLLHKVISMSGVATSTFFSCSPQFAATISGMLLAMAGVNATLGPEAVHDQLVATPLNRLMQINEELINIYGLTTFVPVVESPHPGVTPMLLQDPEKLIESGAGEHIPLLLGFTDREMETFRPRIDEIDLGNRIKETPALVVPTRLTYKSSPAALPELIEAIKERCYGGAGAAGAAGAVAGFMRCAGDALYAYPAFRAARQRAAAGAPVYLYKFSYGGQRSAVKGALGLRFLGAGHIEDLTYVFRPNSYFAPATVLAPTDQRVIHFMTDTFVRYVSGQPTGWAGAGRRLRYLAVSARAAGAAGAAGSPRPRPRPPTPRELDMISFFDALHAAAEQ